MMMRRDTDGISVKFWDLPEKLVLGRTWARQRRESTRSASHASMRKSGTSSRVRA